MFGTGAARLLGGVLRDTGGMQLVLSFALILQGVCGVLLAACTLAPRRTLHLCQHYVPLARPMQCANLPHNVLLQIPCGSGAGSWSSARNNAARLPAPASSLS